MFQMKLWRFVCFSILLLQNLWYIQASRDGFVKTRGTHFLLNGYPFYANGFNAYWLMFVASDPNQRSRVTAAFREAASHGLTVARTWAFSDGGYRPLQYSPGVYNEQMFLGLDFVVAEARKYRMKLILSFVNNYESFGGKKQYVSWARNQGQSLSDDDDFFTNPLVKNYYKNHIKTVVNRYNKFTGIHYKDDPTIMSWELMNEPRCSSDPSGKTIQTWITEMASHVKSIDKNHLLEAGLEGFYGESTPERKNLNPNFNIGTDFFANNKISDIDFATFHSYPDQWITDTNEQTQLSFLDKWLDAHIQDAQNMIHKPILLAEFGKSSTYGPNERDTLFSRVYDKVYASAKRGGAAAGALFWQLLAEDMGSFQDGYGIILSEESSTVNLISQRVHKLHQIQNLFARKVNMRKWKGRRVGNRGSSVGT